MPQSELSGFLLTLLDSSWRLLRSGIFLIHHGTCLLVTCQRCEQKNLSGDALSAVLSDWTSALPRFASLCRWRMKCATEPPPFLAPCGSGRRARGRVRAPGAKVNGLGRKWTA